MLVSLIVPAYKQEKTIKEDITRIYETMRDTRWNFELLVIVDGIVDDTYNVVKEIEKPNLRVYGYQTNKGKGYAVRYGMARTRGELVGFIDAGMEINPNNISMIIEHMIWYEADIMVGSKRHPASKVKYPPIRRLYSWCYQMLVRLLFNLKIKDTQVGLKIFKREVLEKVLPRLMIKEYAFDIELLAVANYLGYRRIFEVPVKIEYNFDSGSRFSSKLIFDPFVKKMLVDTLAVFYRMYVIGYYSDNKKRSWKYDDELKLEVNTGGYQNA